MMVKCTVGSRERDTFFGTVVGYLVLRQMAHAVVMTTERKLVTVPLHQLEVMRTEHK